MKKDIPQHAICPESIDKDKKSIRHADAQPMPLQSQSKLIKVSIIAEGWVTFI